MPQICVTPLFSKLWLLIFAFARSITKSHSLPFRFVWRYLGCSELIIFVFVPEMELQTSEKVIVYEQFSDTILQFSLYRTCTGWHYWSLVTQQSCIMKLYCHSLSSNSVPSRLIHFLPFFLWTLYRFSNLVFCYLMRALSVSSPAPAWSRWESPSPLFTMNYRL